MLPSQFSEFKVYPHVNDFVVNHLDMQFNDVRGIMKLPRPKVGIVAGCNFAAAAALCNLISGISRVLYTPKAPKIGSGTRFKELLENFYPWDPRERKAENAKVIYDLVRNPLTHSLGVLSNSSLPICIRKGPLTEAQLRRIEDSSVRPSWAPQAVTRASIGYDLSVWGLYWGVFHLLRRLAKDTKQMQAAEKRLKSARMP